MITYTNSTPWKSLPVHRSRVIRNYSNIKTNKSTEPILLKTYQALKVRRITWLTCISKYPQLRANCTPLKKWLTRESYDDDKGQEFADPYLLDQRLIKKTWQISGSQSGRLHKVYSLHIFYPLLIRITYVFSRRHFIVRIQVGEYFFHWLYCPNFCVVWMFRIWHFVVNVLSRVLCSGTISLFQNVEPFIPNTITVTRHY